MSVSAIAGNGPYEEWATRLRAWSADPRTSLDGLPTLTDDSFDQSTYLRLMGRTNDAVAIFMQTWKVELVRAFERAPTPHSLATELVRLRQLLRPRLVLAEHPGWPDAIRSALTTGLRTDLAMLQEELEKSMAHSSNGARVDRRHADELVAVVRRTPLTSLIDRDAAAAVAVLPVTNQPSPSSSPPGRRILL